MMRNSESFEHELALLNDEVCLKKRLKELLRLWESHSNRVRKQRVQDKVCQLAGELLQDMGVLRQDPALAEALVTTLKEVLGDAPAVGTQANRAMFPYGAPADLIRDARLACGFAHLRKGQYDLADKRFREVFGLSAAESPPLNLRSAGSLLQRGFDTVVEDVLKQYQRLAVASLALDTFCDAWRKANRFRELELPGEIGILLVDNPDASLPAGRVARLSVTLESAGEVEINPAPELRAAFAPETLLRGYAEEAITAAYQHPILRGKRHSVGFSIDIGSEKLSGDSFGLALTLAILSAAVQEPLPPGLTVTGAIERNGRVTLVGGMDAKARAAFWSRASVLSYPEENTREERILPQTRQRLKDAEIAIHAVRHRDEALDLVLPQLAFAVEEEEFLSALQGSAPVMRLAEPLLARWAGSTVYPELPMDLGLVWGLDRTSFVGVLVSDSANRVYRGLLRVERALLEAVAREAEHRDSAVPVVPRRWWLRIPVARFPTAPRRGSDLAECLSPVSTAMAQHLRTHGLPESALLGVFLEGGAHPSVARDLPEAAANWCRALFYDLFPEREIAVLVDAGTSGSLARSVQQSLAPTLDEIRLERMTAMPSLQPREVSAERWLPGVVQDQEDLLRQAHGPLKEGKASELLVALLLQFREEGTNHAVKVAIGELRRQVGRGLQQVTDLLLGSIELEDFLEEADADSFTWLLRFENMWQNVLDLRALALDPADPWWYLAALPPRIEGIQELLHLTAPARAVFGLTTACEWRAVARDAYVSQQVYSCRRERGITFRRAASR